MLLCYFKNTPFSSGNVSMMGLRDDIKAETDKKKNAPFLELKPFDRPIRL